jgi:hypothetical protein
MCRAGPENSRKFAAHHHHRQRERLFARLRIIIIVGRRADRSPATGAAAALTRSALKRRLDLSRSAGEA